MVDAQTANRLSVDIERLLPKCRGADLDESRRVAFAQAALGKIEAFEAAAGGDAALLSKVATYEEAMLQIIASLRPEDAPTSETVVAAARAPAAPGGGGEAGGDAAGDDAASLPSDDLSDGDDDDDGDAASEAAGTSAKVDADEATALQHDLEKMTAQMKESSLAVNDKLKRQNAAMERLDEATATNQDAVKGSRGELEKRAQAKNWQLFQAIGALFVVALSWVSTYVFMSIFPKHRTS